MTLSGASRSNRTSSRYKQDVTIWQALEEKFRRGGTLSSTYLDNYPTRSPASENRKFGRMMIPAFE